MDDKIRSLIHQAYTGEAKAAIRLKVFAEKAASEDYAQLAKLFAVIAYSEEIKCKRALRLLKEVGSTEQNLAESFESETKVAGVAYADFIRQAEAAGDTASSSYFAQSKDVEESHARLYKEALGHVMDERQTTYYVCGFCGYVADGRLPETCPVCGVARERFVEFGAAC
ncbi:MAG: Rubrerythrin-2 [Deltaproteobacteria bacterium ADurb.Bin510]|nr:MAG: Rubrerythrin-2 [Deltaproteobacteria bacterium ADurb.Bin510]